MKKLITILAIVLTVQCMAQEKDSIPFNKDDRYRRTTALNDCFSVVSNGKIITGKLDENKSDNLVPETPITIEDIERWIEHCYNDSTLVEVPYQCSMIGCLVHHAPVNEWQHKDPNDIVGLLKWLKQTK